MKEIISEKDEPKYRHRIPVQLRFSDVDRFGHVNNSVYFSLYDLAKTDYLQNVLGMGLNPEAVVPVVANIHADFLQPVFFDDPIAIETTTVHVGNKSFTLRQRAVNTKTNQPVCVCQTVLVCFSLKEQAAVSVPDDVKASIVSYESLA